MGTGILTETYSGQTRLTNMSLLHINKDHIAMEMVPGQPAALPNGQYYTHDRSHQALLGNPHRGPGGTAVKVRHGYSTQSYVAHEYALEADVPLENIEYADGPLDPDGDEALLLRDQLMTQVEYDVASAIDATTDWSTNHSLTLAGTTQWSHASSTPLTNFESGREQFRSHFGFYPNGFAMGAPVWSKLQFHADILNAIKYTGVGRAPMQVLATLLDVDVVLVGKGVYLSSNVGQTTETMADIWGKHAWYFYRPPTAALKQQAFAWHFKRPLVGTGGLTDVTERRLNSGNLSLQVRSRMSTGFNIVSQDSSNKATAGYFYKDAVA